MGLRFQSIYLGSRSFVGELTPHELGLRDADGITLREAIAGEPAPPLYDPRTEAYFEVHIEQGPVLEAEGLPLGVVTAIAGQSRFNLTFAGHAGHAGTTPMHLRRDAPPRPRSSCSRRSGSRSTSPGWWRPSASSASRAARST